MTGPTDAPDDNEGIGNPHPPFGPGPDDEGIGNVREDEGHRKRADDLPPGVEMGDEELDRPEIELPPD